MILGEFQIVSRLLDPEDKRRIVITPLVCPDVQIGPSSIDVHLGTDFRVIEGFNTSHLDLAKEPEQQALDARKYAPSRRVNALRVEAFTIHPGEFALASTLEFIRVPVDLAARIEGRSSVGRLGLQVHATAGFVDPGYSGTLTFELYNAGKLPISLYAGLRLAQLCFFLCDGALQSYSEREASKYRSPMYTVASQLYRDLEVKKLSEARARLQE